MPLSDRDYIRGNHPPNCSCVDCVNKRLGIKSQNIKSQRNIPENKIGSQSNNTKIKQREKLPSWLKAILFLSVFAIIGVLLCWKLGTDVPLWVLFGFSIIFSLEKWFHYQLGKNKVLGKLYRLLLNLVFLSLLGILIWTGIKLFSKEFVQNALIGSSIFICELGIFIWFWRVLARNSWRWPSLKLTVFSLIVLFIIFAFAGVQPPKEYKDEAFSYIASVFDNLSPPTSGESQSTPTQTLVSTPTSISLSPKTSTSTTTTINGIDNRTGVYKNYYLGLVKTPEGVLHGNECYGSFIILINNKDAKNPTYAELLSFLQPDKTDEFLYQYSLPLFSSYYGEAEDKIDLNRVKHIIDGTEKPNPPMICADFAERLHNNAELAGIRCAYVSLDMVGYTDPQNLGIASDSGHACDAFETTDRGLVYIDCTGNTDSYGPANNDMIVVIQVGQDYNPEYIFPSGGWYVPTGMMGKVTNIFLTWDGEWRD
jgi:hypothetical protein